MVKWDWTKDTDDRWPATGATLVIGAFVQMFVSMVLDLATSMPEEVWVTLWIVMPFVYAAFVFSAYTFSYWRDLSNSQRQALKAYLRLPKEVTDNLPRTTERDLRRITNDRQLWDLRSEFDHLLDEHNRLKALNPSGKEKGEELLDAVRNEKKILADTYKDMRALGS